MTVDVWIEFGACTITLYSLSYCLYQIKKAPLEDDTKDK